MIGEEFQLFSPKKLIVFGANKTGKSSFTSKLLENKIEESQSIIKDEDNSKKILINIKS